jgi:hypothetical protein
MCVRVLVASKKTQVRNARYHLSEPRLAQVNLGDEDIRRESSFVQKCKAT